MAMLWVCCSLGKVFSMYGLFKDDAGVEVWVEFVEGVNWVSVYDWLWVEVDVLRLFKAECCGVCLWR